MALLGLGHATVDGVKGGTTLDLGQRTVERGTVNFRLQIREVAIAIGVLPGRHLLISDRATRPQAGD